LGVDKYLPIVTERTMVANHESVVGKTILAVSLFVARMMGGSQGQSCREHVHQMYVWAVVAVVGIAGISWIAGGGQDSLWIIIKGAFKLVYTKMVVLSWLGGTFPEYFNDSMAVILMSFMVQHVLEDSLRMQGGKDTRWLRGLRYVWGGLVVPLYLWYFRVEISVNETAKGEEIFWLGLFLGYVMTDWWYWTEFGVAD